MKDKNENYFWRVRLCKIGCKETHCHFYMHLHRPLHLVNKRLIWWETKHLLGLLLTDYGNMLGWTIVMLYYCKFNLNRNIAARFDYKHLRIYINVIAHILICIPCKIVFVYWIHMILIIDLLLFIVVIQVHLMTHKLHVSHSCSFVITYFKVCYWLTVEIYWIDQAHRLTSCQIYSPWKS